MLVDGVGSWGKCVLRLRCMYTLLRMADEDQWYGNGRSAMEAEWFKWRSTPHREG